MSSLTRKKSFFQILSHYMSLNRSFIIDHSLVEDYNLNVYQKNDMKTNTTF